MVIFLSDEYNSKVYEQLHKRWLEVHILPGSACLEQKIFQALN